MKKCVNKENSALIYMDGKITRCYQDFLQNKVHVGNLNNKNITDKLKERCSKFCNIKSCRSSIETLYLITSTLCPFNCPYCVDMTYSKFHSENIEAFNIENIRKSLEVLDYKKAKTIIFGNYEPFSNIDNLKDSLLLLKNYTGNIYIYTTGYIYDEDILDIIKTMKSNIKILININGTKEIHDKAKNNSYDIIVNNIKRFYEYTSESSNIEIDVETVIFKESIDSLDEILGNLDELSKYCDNIKLDSERFSLEFTDFIISKYIICNYIACSKTLSLAIENYRSHTLKYNGEASNIGIYEEFFKTKEDANAL